MILADDQGWGDLSSSGNTNLATPNIDALATNGVKFENFYVSPVCSPTRAEMLTGRYHPRGGVFGTSAGGELLDLDEETIAEVLSAAGYATGAFGKWHNGMQPPYHPNARGFDEFYGFASGHWGDYFSPNLLEHNGTLVKGNGFMIDDFTDWALDFIETNAGNPFFAYLPYNTPHSPMQVPDRWWEKFDDDSSLKLRHREPERENTQHTRAALAMVENIDWNVGRIQEKVRALNLERNTIIIYFTDNGPNGSRWNGGMKGRKGSTDEGGVKSPFYMQWVDTIEAGSSVEEIAGAIDLLPTLAEMAGIQHGAKQPLDGVSLKPLLDGADAWEDRYIFSHWRGNTSVRDQNYRLGADNQLFDMAADFGQTTDVSDNVPVVATAMREAKEAWEAEVLAEFNREPRPFPVGHPDFTFTQLPIRDAEGTGRIERSNRYPNDSFFRNWVDVNDQISWNVDVLTAGEYEAVLYYACPEDDLGATIALAFGGAEIQAQVTVANDPPLLGAENDRDPRQESYVKDFKPMTLGTITLEAGAGSLTLRALEMPGSQVMEVRLLMLNRVNAE
ncbi:MAG: arylsulfatase [Bacteroidota bacterium]